VRSPVKQCMILAITRKLDPNCGAAVHMRICSATVNHGSVVLGPGEGSSTTPWEAPQWRYVPQTQNGDSPITTLDGVLVPAAYVNRTLLAYHTH